MAKLMKQDLDAVRAARSLAGLDEAKKMVLMSTIMARAARLRPWSVNDLASFSSTQLQEVQCMSAGGKIYIAGNGHEGKLVVAFLNAFGVKDANSLKECLTYTHWVLSTTAQGMSGYFPVKNDLNYSLSEKQSVQFAHGILDFDITTDEKETAGKIMNKDYAGKYSEAEIKQSAKKYELGWFLRKLSGLQGDASRNACYTRASGSVSSNDAIGVCVLKDNSDTHAELKLLAHLTKLAMQDSSYHNKNIAVGGLKRACNHCRNWIERYEKWAWLQFKISLTCTSLQGDTVRSEGGGAGDRPDLSDFGQINQPQGSSNDGRFVSLLFNGKANGSWNDLDGAIDDDVLWR